VVRRAEVNDRSRVGQPVASCYNLGMPRGDARESLNLLVSPEVKRKVEEFAKAAGISTNAAASVFLADAAGARAARVTLANPQCQRCRGYGELCTGGCAARIDQAADDIAAIAMYAKTHADGPVWEAACRVLGRTAF
jgi:radical SAM protein with 4Fe4S-binding SPASM domain